MNDKYSDLNKVLAENGVTAAMLECMVTLVKEPDETQKRAEDYYKVQIEKDQLEKRYKFALRKQFYLEKRVKVLEEKLKANSQEIIEEMFGILNDIVWIDPTEMEYLDRLKDVQNKASWCITKFGYEKEGAINE